MIRPITIQAVLNGFKCTVGCQELVFETTEGMMQHLYRYLQNPEKTEMEFLSSPAAINVHHTMPGSAQVNEARAATDYPGQSPMERVAEYRRNSAGAEQGRQTNPVPTHSGDGIGVARPGW